MHHHTHQTTLDTVFFNTHSANATSVNATSVNATSINVAVLTVLILIAFFLTMGPLSATAAPPCCDHAITLDPNSTQRSFGGEDELYALHLPTTGIVTLDLIHAERSSPPSRRKPMQIDLVSGNATVVERSAAHLVLAVDAAETIVLHVASSAGYHLVSGFAAARLDEETFSASSPSDIHFVRRRFFASVLTRKGDPEEVDPDPDSSSPQSKGGQLLLELLSPRPALTTKGDPEEVDPDPDAPGGSVATDRTAPARAVRPSVVFYEPVCVTAAAVEGDDHAETLSCASSIQLDTTTTGRLGDVLGGDGEGNDSDVFVVHLTTLTTVRIATHGDSDTFGTLYDTSGQELASNDDGALNGNFRIVRALAPGRYYVRVDAVGSAGGAYELTVTTPGR